MKASKLATVKKVFKAQGLPWDSLCDEQKIEREHGASEAYVKGYGKLPPQRQVDTNKTIEP